MQSRDYKHRKAIALAKLRADNKCEICESDLDINGHHIIDYAFGGEADPDNILVVCKSCHDKIHNGEIQIDIFDYRGNK